MTGFAHTRHLVVEWGHCDPAGIVFNPRFFEYFDHATALLLEAALGEGKAAFTARFGIVGIPLVDTHARFLLPCRFGDAVAIHSTVAAVGRSSFTVSHRLHRGETLAVEGEEVRVWSGRDPADASRLRGVPIPDEVRNRLLGI